MTKNYYTTTEIAGICSVSPTTIFRAVTNKQLKASTTPGGHFRIHKHDLEDFLRKNNIPLPDSDPATKKILIVEDNPVELRMFQRALLADPTFKVEATHSGYAAGFLTQSFKPDLILLDIILPDIDGREVAKLIKSEDSLKQTKIVAITALKSEKELKDIKSAGFNAFIQKPISPEDLRERIKAILK